MQAIAGLKVESWWRAPGGRAPAPAMRAAEQCGFRHVHWADAGFLGDELPSEKFPNDRLLAQALSRIRDGDILMAHLGIWSRKDPFAPMLDPLIAGLKRKGFCFRTLDQHPDYRF
jgi:peptidoglycan/xylan/chitin deacetylase (PgdA/CDA1 family)